MIEAVGPHVSGFSAGQAVSIVPGFFSQSDYGVYAERTIVPAATRSLTVNAVHCGT